MTAAEPSQSTRPVNAVQLAAFFKRHVPSCRTWRREIIVPWTEWFLRMDLALVIVDGAGRIVGAAIGRMLNDLSEGDRVYVTHPDGRIVWIDAIVSRHPAVIGQLLLLLKIKWGDREAVAGCRFTRNQELQCFPMATLKRFFGG